MVELPAFVTAAALRPLRRVNTLTTPAKILGACSCVCYWS